MLREIDFNFVSADPNANNIISHLNSYIRKLDKIVYQDKNLEKPNPSEKRKQVYKGLYLRAAAMLIKFTERVRGADEDWYFENLDILFSVANCLKRFAKFACVSNQNQCMVQFERYYNFTEVRLLNRVEQLSRELVNEVYVESKQRFVPNKEQANVTLRYHFAGNPVCGSSESKVEKVSDLLKRLLTEKGLFLNPQNREALTNGISEIFYEDVGERYCGQVPLLFTTFSWFGKGVIKIKNVAEIEEIFTRAIDGVLQAGLNNGVAVGFQ